MINTIIPISPKQLGIIPTKSFYGLSLETDEGYWVENKIYEDLNSAQQAIKQYDKTRQIQLRNWSLLPEGYPVITLHKNSRKPHIWLGQDTVCNLLARATTEQGNSYNLSTELAIEPYCKSCASKVKQIKNLKFTIIFNNQNEVIHVSIKNKNLLSSYHSHNLK